MIPMIHIHIKIAPTEMRLCGAEDMSAIWEEDFTFKDLEQLCEECAFIYTRGGVKVGCTLMGCNGGGLHIWIEPRTWLPWPHWAFRRLFPKSLGGPS